MQKNIDRTNNTDAVNLEYSKELAENLFKCDLYSGNKIASAFRHLYPFWNDFNSFLPINIWREINNSNEISKDVFSEFIHQLINPTDSIFDQWHHMYVLDDEQYKKLLAKTEIEFNTPTVQSIEEIIDFIKNICIAFEKGRTRWSRSDLEEKLNKYVDIIMDNIINKSTIDFDEYYNQTQIVKDKTTIDVSEHSLFTAIKGRLLKKIEDHYNISNQKLFDDLIKQIEHPETFEDWYYKNNIIKINIFSFQNPQRLWDSIKKLEKTKDFRSIQENLRTRIVNYIVDKEKQASEIEFWKKYMDIMKHDKDEWEKENKYIWKCDYVNIFIELVVKAFNEIEQPKFVKKI